MGFFYEVTLGMEEYERMIFRKTTVENTFSLNEKEIERIAISRVNVQVRYRVRVFEIQEVKKI